MGREIIIGHNGIEYRGQIGTIKATNLGYEAHGILSASLVLEWSGGGISVGGYSLDKAKDPDAGDYARVGTAYGLDHIIRIMETVGVSRWEALPGKQVIALFEGKSMWGSVACGIASTVDESAVLVFKEHADTWRESEAS